MKKDLVLDERELKEIHHSLFYRENFAHGTAGHNLFMLIGKMADALGFELKEETLVFIADPTPKDLIAPKELVVIRENS